MRNARSKWGNFEARGRCRRDVLHSVSKRKGLGINKRANEFRTYVEYTSIHRRGCIHLYAVPAKAGTVAGFLESCVSPEHLRLKDGRAQSLHALGESKHARGVSKHQRGVTKHQRGVQKHACGVNFQPASHTFSPSRFPNPVVSRSVRGDGAWRIRGDLLSLSLAYLSTDYSTYCCFRLLLQAFKPFVAGSHARVLRQSCNCWRSHTRAHTALDIMVVRRRGMPPSSPAPRRSRGPTQ